MKSIHLLTHSLKYLLGAYFDIVLCSEVQKWIHHRVEKISMQGIFKK